MALLAERAWYTKFQSSLLNPEFLLPSQWFPALAPRPLNGHLTIRQRRILGDPGADKGGEGKCKPAEKYIWNEEK